MLCIMQDCRHKLSRMACCTLLAISISDLLIAVDPFVLRRERMVADQIESRGVRNPDVLRVMRSTPRHLFVPPGCDPWHMRTTPCPLGTRPISQPYVVASMTELLAPAKKLRVLEIGTGSGYQAAILAQLAAEVYTIEIVPELAQSAAATLRELGYTNVSVRQGDGYKGWPEKAPFDRIILTAAPPEIPEALIAQLSEGGRLVAPVGARWNQELIVIEGRWHNQAPVRNSGELRADEARRQIDRPCRPALPADAAGPQFY